MHELIKEVATLTETRLERLFSEMENESASTLFKTYAGSDVLQQVKELTLRGGKRLRAALLVYTAALFDEEAHKRPYVVDTAAALELLQTYFLIHDDIMDGDATRRGGPSAHVALTQLTGDPQMGLALAILAGDLAVALHQILVARLDVSPQVHRKIVSLFAEMHLDVIHGQTLDMSTESQPMDVAEHKTSSYTTIGPVAIGAALTGADDDEVEKLAGLARPLGIAFQLRDDLIGIFGDPAKTGKPIGTDIKLAKKTFVLNRALEVAQGSDKAALEAAYGNPEATDVQVAQATQAIIDCGARASCEELIGTLADAFIDGIEAGSYNPQAARFLIEAAHFLAERQS